jgi:hypothetical protein
MWSLWQHGPAVQGTGTARYPLLKKKTMLTYPPAISRLYWLSMIDRFLMQMESMIVPLLKQPVLPEMEGYRDDWYEREDRESRMLWESTNLLAFDISTATSSITGERNITVESSTKSEGRYIQLTTTNHSMSIRSNKKAHHLPSRLGQATIRTLYLIGHRTQTTVSLSIHLHAWLPLAPRLHDRKITKSHLGHRSEWNTLIKNTTS